MSRSLLEVESVMVSYSGIRAVSDITMVVPESSVVALLGANGAGKTTILRAVSGLVHPESGVILLSGQRIDRLPPHRIARLGVLHVPEGRGIFPSLTVKANLEMASYVLSRGADPASEGTALFPQLGPRIDQLAGTLSGGEQQMLALARALVARPRLLMLDEISMGLAPLVVEGLYEVVRTMAAAGTTVMLVEQHMQAALAIADYVYVLDKGHVVDVGQPDDLGGTGVVAAYLGSGP